MSDTNLSPVFVLLYEIEEARKEGCRRVCELLPLAQTPKIATILIENESQLGDKSFCTPLEKVGDIVLQHKVQRNITDWPFENFWNNPHEPRHSKLLGYFIDPKQGHGCDDFLRHKLLEVLKDSLNAHKCRPTVQYRFRDDGCNVEAETRDVQPGDNNSGQIDLLITRQCDDDRSDNNRNFAIIVENKINRASNQPKQLEKYVARFRRAGFSDEQIFVFFLPLTDDLNPDSDDLKAILGKVTYEKITFKKHIRNWLEAALEEWPADLDKRIREHLSYYRNLIKHLINQREQDTMKANILKQIEQAEQKNLLPTWSQVENLQKSAVELKQCLESVLRGKLLLRVQSLLREMKVNVGFYMADGTEEKQTLNSTYDERFEWERNLGIPVGANVIVCLGGYGDGGLREIFWTGYMRSGSNEEQEKHKNIIIKEAQRWSMNIAHNNPPWYVWDWIKEIDYDNCVAELTVDRLANKLLNMRNSLEDQLKKESFRS